MDDPGSGTVRVVIRPSEFSSDGRETQEPRSSETGDRASWADVALFGIAGLTALGLFIESLWWRFDFDAPLFLYAGHLVAEGQVPYRDFYDFNMPLTLWINWGIVEIFGYSDLGVRLADLLLVGLVALATALFLGPFGRRVAGLGALLFVLSYLGAGPLFSLQREFLLLLPLSWGLVAVAWPFRRPAGLLRPLLAGVSMALAVLVKPHAVLIGPVLVAYLLWEDHREPQDAPRGPIRLLGVFGAGCALPLALTAIVLAWQGALGPFLEIARGYWPLYGALSGEMEVLDPMHAAEYRIVLFTSQLSLSHLLLPALLGIWVVARGKDPRLRSMAGLLLGSLVAFAGYALAAGKLWSYHWIPFVYIAVVAAAVFARPWTRLEAGIVVRWVVVLQLCAFAWPSLYFSLHGAATNEVKDGRVDAMAAFLEAELEPGDTVQALDITGGALNAMFRARAHNATRFLMAKYFFHPLDEPYVRQLRQQFIEELEAEPPRFVLEITDIWHWIRGPGVDSEFPELRRLLDERYSVVETGSGYRIHELR